MKSVRVYLWSWIFTKQVSGQNNPTDWQTWVKVDRSIIIYVTIALLHYHKKWNYDTFQAQAYILSWNKSSKLMSGYLATIEVFCKSNKWPVYIGNEVCLIGYCCRFQLDLVIITGHEKKPAKWTHHNHCPYSTKQKVNCKQRQWQNYSDWISLIKTFVWYLMKKIWQGH